MNAFKAMQTDVWDKCLQTTNPVEMTNSSPGLDSAGQKPLKAVLENLYGEGWLQAAKQVGVGIKVTVTYMASQRAKTKKGTVNNHRVNISVSKMHFPSI